MLHRKRAIWNKGPPKEGDVKKNYEWIRYVVYLLALFIGISRIVIGVHSWNQVLYGYVIGFLVIQWLNDHTWRQFLLWVGL